ncbi:hypothetical protein RUM43_009435 [Polyplax serrata]|uniref:Uncharacterized protein n=1 Tax=Polyplax serrata TaxID=468196 RepID=A0AAN8S263_POLSC
MELCTVEFDVLVLIENRQIINNILLNSLNLVLQATWYSKIPVEIGSSTAQSTSAPPSVVAAATEAAPALAAFLHILDFFHVFRGRGKEFS